MDISASTLSVQTVDAKSFSIDGNAFKAIATSTTLGGVKINGNNLAIAADGTLSAAGGGSSSGPKVWINDPDSSVVEITSTLNTGDIICGCVVNNEFATTVNQIHYNGYYWMGDDIMNGIFIGQGKDMTTSVPVLIIGTGSSSVSYTRQS